MFPDQHGVNQNVKIGWTVLLKKLLQKVKNFRMKRKPLDFLCEGLYPFLCRQNTKIRKAISVRRHVAISLWRLSTNTDYRTNGHPFGVSKASVCDIIN